MDGYLSTAYFTEPLRKKIVRLTFQNLARLCCWKIERWKLFSRSWLKLFFFNLEVPKNLTPSWELTWTCIQLTLGVESKLETGECSLSVYGEKYFLGISQHWDKRFSRVLSVVFFPLLIWEVICYFIINGTVKHRTTAGLWGFNNIDWLSSLPHSN